MHVIEADQLREKLSLSVLIDVDEGLFYRLRDGIFPGHSYLDWIIEVLRRQPFDSFVIGSGEQ